MENYYNPTKNSRKFQASVTETYASLSIGKIFEKYLPVKKFNF